MPPQQSIVLITGANSGVGYAAAKVIASASPTYHVIMCARSEAKGQAALARLQKETSLMDRLSFVRLDVEEPASIDAAAKEVDQRFGRLDVLINNAGIAESPAQHNTADRLNQIFATNCTGPALVSAAFKPLLATSRLQNPYSIFITSSLGSLALATETNHQSYHVTYTTYRMSKAALNMLMIQEAREYRDTGKGVKAFAVCPGLVRSNLRGTRDEEVSAGGNAGDPEVSGQTILDVIEGKRDGDVGQFIHKDGRYPW